MGKKGKPFNNPFGGVKLEKPPTPPRPPPLEVEPPRPSRGPEPLSEDDLWAVAIDGTTPLEDRAERIRPGKAPIAVAPQLDPELEAYDELRALVTGEVPFDIADSDEFIEGHARGLARHVVRKLRRGDFAIQAHLDLHGMLKDEAKLELEAFLARTRQKGMRCVLVVHGRGLHSKDQVPILKDALRKWMRTARFAQHVLAFCTARPHDGGAGAIYVLLKR